MPVEMAAMEQPLIFQDLGLITEAVVQVVPTLLVIINPVQQLEAG
jgi:hypothetical protein